MCVNVFILFTPITQNIGCDIQPYEETLLQQNATSQFNLPSAEWLHVCFLDLINVQGRIKIEQWHQC